MNANFNTVSISDFITDLSQTIIIIIILIMLFIWCFIKSAISKGVEEGIYNAVTELQKDGKYPLPNEIKEYENFKTP